MDDTASMGARMPDPGWYDDPEDDAQLRWWDGARWTERRQPRATVETPPPPPPPSPGSSYGIPLGDAGAGSAAGGSGGGPGGGPSVWDTASSGTTDWGSGASSGSGAYVLAGAAPPRNFWDAIKVCLTKYVDAKGRASRSEYWYFALFTFLLDLATGGFAAILTLLPSITVSVRRLHDIGKSGWALLWILLPVIGWIVLIVYAVRPGEPHTNAYG
jgi:uncharacterized membrane protein YhaH (DUF805 family)